MLPAQKQFGPQPKLDMALAHEKNCETDLLAARRQLVHEAELLKELDRKRAETLQQADAESDKLSTYISGGSSGAEIGNHSRHIDALRGMSERFRLETEAQRRQVNWATRRVELRRKAMAEAESARRAIQKTKERWEAEQRKAARKAEQREQDDDAAMRWNR